MKNEKKLKKMAERIEGKLGGIDPLQFVLKLAQDYFAISDSGLLPKEKWKLINMPDTQKMEAFNREVEIWNAVIHECRLRYLKNRMTKEELIYKLYERNPLGIRLCEQRVEIIAQEIFEAVEKKNSKEKRNRRGKRGENV